MSGEKTESIAWTCIGIGLFMQVFGSIWLGTGLVSSFSNLPTVTDAASLFTWLTTLAVDLVQALLGFLSQDWAAHFWAPLRYAILVVFDLSLLLLVAGNPVLLVVAAVASIVAALASIF